MRHPIQWTGAITGRVNAEDPEHKKLTYTLISGPPEGKLVFNKTTGAFTYTPTAAQRVRAQTEGPQTVQFNVTVSDGIKANNQLAPVTVDIHPTQIADIGEVAAGDGALGLAVTNTRAYVTNFDAGTVTVIDTIHRSVVTTIDVDDLPIGVAVTPDGKKVYVSSLDTNTVSVIDAATNTVTSRIDLRGQSPQLMAISPDGKTLYVTTTTFVQDPDFPDEFFVVASGITKISTATNRITGTVKNVGLVPYGITVSRDGKKVYVIAEVESDGDYTTGVFVFSSASTTAKQILGVGTRPEAVTVSPDGKTAYIGDFATGTISVVETTKYTGHRHPGRQPGDRRRTRGQSRRVAVDGAQLRHPRLGRAMTSPRTTTPLTSASANATTELNFSEAALSPDGQQLYYTSDGALQVISLVPANQFPVKNLPTINAPNAATGVVTGTVGVTDPNNDKLTYTPTTPPRAAWSSTPTAPSPTPPPPPPDMPPRRSTPTSRP